jgi:hypothetical protein
MRRSRGWLGVCAIVVALAWPGASAARAATAGGGGTFSLLSADMVPAGQATTVEFSYTAPAPPVSAVVLPPVNVTVTVSLPTGWTATAPATVSCQASGCGVESQSGTQIVVGMSLRVARTFTLDYPATPPGSAGTFPFGATQEFGGNATALPALTVAVTCPDGAGTMSADPGSMTAGQSTDLKFTYTAGSCGVGTGGEVAVTVPGQWAAPTPATVTWSGSPAPMVSGWMITVLVGSVGPGASVTFSYDMARAPASASGYTFDAFEQSSATGSLQALATSPEVTVTAAVVTSSPSVSVTGSPSVSVTSSPSVSASGGAVSPSVSASGGGTSPPASAGGLPIALVGFGLAGLGLVGLALAAGASLLASRLLHRGGHGTGGGSVRAVPHTGPPPSVTVRDSGIRPALTVRLEPHAGATMTTIEEKRP